jgi:calcium-dependent protein kinase
MEHCGQGDFSDYIEQNGPLSENLAATVMRKLLSAVNYLHRNGIFHRDLKPSNILLTRCATASELEPKIIDFGLAAFVHPERKAKTVAGSTLYMAPEVFKRKYNHLCDVWSLGCIMHTLLVGLPPFIEKTEEKTVNAIRYHVLPLPDSISMAGKSLLRQLLSKHPRKRIEL